MSRASVADQRPAATSFVVPEAVPALTAAPGAAAELLKREGGPNTCGFIDGDPAIQSQVTCVGSGSECYYDSAVSAIGCCMGGDCLIWTACLPYSSSALASVDLERTMYCSDLGLPECATYFYRDPEWDEYTLVACDSVKTTYKFYASTFADSSTETTTSDPGPTTTVPPVPPENDSSPPVGAIVGGVVGGVVLIVLVIALIIFYRRAQSRKPADDSHKMPLESSMPGHDPRISVATTSMSMYTPTTAMSPVNHAQTQQPVFCMTTPTSPPPLYGTSPSQQYGGNRHFNTATELPTVKPDGQLRELE